MMRRLLIAGTRIAIALTWLAAGLPTLASAQVAAPRVITISERVEAPVAPVWALVGDFSGLARWNPALQSLTTKEIGGQTYRTAHFAGWSITERLDRRDDAHHRIEYTLVDSTRAALIGSRASIALTPIGADATQVRWVATQPRTPPPTEAGNAALAQYFRRRIGELAAAARPPPPK